MTDFHQIGQVTTLHLLKERPLESLENDLWGYAKHLPIALVLPALYSEFEGKAMPRILDEIARVPYLREVVVALGCADAEQFAEVRTRVSGVHPRVRVIWIDGPRIQRVYERLREANLDVGDNGKGRSCWTGFGYVLAGGRSKVIVLHDGDILNYSRGMLARLCCPLVNPHLDFVFAKGYYARVTEKMHGRVTRLLVWPLIGALESVLGLHPFLSYLGNFRYPLAGEFCMTAELARVNRIPSNWGLEVGVLAEVYRNSSARRICQVDICDNYEHKHQSLSADNPEKGLMRMTVDITKTLLRILASEGLTMPAESSRTLQARYLRAGEDHISRYHADAAINSLDFDPHAEEEMLNAFAHGVRVAAEDVLADPVGPPPIPNWNHVASAIPGISMMLEEAVELDHSTSETSFVMSYSSRYE